MSSYESIKSVCDKIGCEYNENTLLSSCTSFKIGGKADFLFSLIRSKSLLR